MVHLRIIGVGNRYRGDDAVGPVVVDQLRASLPAECLAVSDGEITGLLSHFESTDRVILVDAIDGHGAGLEAGTLMQIDPQDDALSPGDFRGSTHSLGILEAIELARTLGCLPASLTLFGIAGRCFDHGEALSAPVREAADRLAVQLAGANAHA